jgi:ACS family pantothenate transporter-like MFS transporter
MLNFMLTFLLLSVWKTVDAPRYLVGYNWTIALDVCMLAMLAVLYQFWAREKRLSYT